MFEYKHWHKAICGHDLISDEGKHEFGFDHICDVCGFKKPHSSGTTTPSKPNDFEITEGCPKDHTCPIHPFRDAKTTAWYHDGVHYCLEEGLMFGYENGTIFKPNAPTTRAMTVTMLWRLEHCPTVDYDMTFEDVELDTWYTEAVRWAQANGIVEGHSDVKFSPNDTITREQMATIMWRYAKFKGYDVSAGNAVSLNSYADASKVSDWAVPAVKWACGVGLIEGIENDELVNLVPRGLATRAQFATILYRYCKFIIG